MITVDVELDKIDNWGPKAREGVMQYLAKGADRGQSIALDRAPVDRGRLQQGIYPPVVEGDTVRWGVEGVPYAKAQEEGTAPFTPPLKPLKEWGRRVLGSPEAGAAVWHKIREEGVEASPYIAPGREAQRRWYASHDAGEYVDRELE